jgi:hypothetical protein
MGRLAALLALTLCAPLAACETPEGCPEVASTFALSMPNGASELVPGSPVRLSWEPIVGTSAVVAFVLVEGDARVPTGTVDVSAGMADIATTDSGAPIPAGVYRIQGVFGGCALSEPVYDAGPVRPLFAQGVRFADTSIAIAAADTPRNIAVTTVSLSTMQLELLLDPTPATPGDELIFATGSVPGELVAMQRQYTFTGRTTSNAAIPGGTYTVIARIHARNETVTYDVTGPQLTWSP